MLKSIQNFFKQPDIVQDDEQLKNELRLFCGIMIEAAAVDGKIEKIEISKIKTTLTELFYENPKEVESVLSYCLTKVSEPNSLHFFTSKINKLFSNKKKISIRINTNGKIFNSKFFNETFIFLFIKFSIYSKFSLLNSIYNKNKY